MWFLELGLFLEWGDVRLPARPLTIPQTLLMICSMAHWIIWIAEDQILGLKFILDFGGFRIQVRPQACQFKLNKMMD